MESKAILVQSINFIIYMKPKSLKMYFSVLFLFKNVATLYS